MQKRNLLLLAVTALVLNGCTKNPVAPSEQESVTNSAAESNSVDNNTSSSTGKGDSSTNNETSASTSVETPSTSDSSVETNNSVHFVVGDYATANKWADGSNHSEIKVNNVVTLSAKGKAVTNTGNYFTSDKSWRFYSTEGGYLQVSVATGYVLDTITIVSKDDKGSFEGYASGKEITVNGSVSKVNIGVVDKQARLQEITVTYKEGTATDGDDDPVVESGWTSEDIALMEELIGETIPYLENTEYDLYESEEFYNDVCLDAYTSQAIFNTYITTLKATYTFDGSDVDDDGNTWYYFYNDNIAIDVVGYTYNGSFFVQLDAYIYEDDDTGGEAEDVTLSSQTAWTTDDTTLFNDIIGEVIPYMMNSEYELAESEYFYDDVEFYAFTNKDVFEAYITTLKATYTFDGSDVDDDGDTWYYFYNDNIAIDVVGYVKNSTFTVLLDAYLPDNGGGEVEPTEPDQDVEIPEDDGNGYKALDFTKGKVQNVTQLGDYWDGMPTTGSPKVLVIPVQFSDVTAASKGYTIDTIKTAFNGTEEDSSLYYESVYNYFYKSSNGKLTLDVTVLDDWFTAEHTWSWYNNSKNNGTDFWGGTGEDSYATGEQTIMNEALAYLDAQGMDLSQFDSDNNGTIDSIVMIYTADTSDDEELGWAWRYWNYLGNGDDYYYYDDVNANDYFWGSYQFFKENPETYAYDFDKINTYTLIHEFSHVLGADDYYDTSYTDHPMDGYDVMDQAIADHSAYTKMIYGWITESRLVTTSSEVTLTLNVFESTGDTIILSNNWDDNLGVFQEYWIVTYYTGTGLNAAPNGLFDEAGIVVYHINATIEADAEYYDEDYGDYYYLVNNNTNVNGENGTLNNLIEYVMNGESYVYGVGDSISATTKDDHANVIPFTFEVVSLADGTATLKFTRQAD